MEFKTNSFYSHEELLNLGFQAIGKNVLISKKTSFYSCDKITIGDNVRIDDFCIFSGQIKLGSYIHISAYTALYGRYGIEIDDFSGLSPRCIVFSGSDDFNGDFLIGPTIDEKFTNVIQGKVRILKYCQIGAGSIIMPNLIINEGAVVGAMSLVNKHLEEWSIYAGIPCKKIKQRKKGLLNYVTLLK